MGRNLLSNKQLFNLSLFAFGLQFANMLQLSNMSSLYKFLGAASGNLPYLWLAAPVSGLIMQPLIGQLSDNTCSRYGKRRPYLFVWGIVAVIAFCILPLSPSVAIAAVCLWIIGFSVNGCQEALRALTGDITPNKQKATAFAWQTIFAGLGAGASALIPYFVKHSIAVSNNVFFINKIPFSLQATFFMGASILLICILWTVCAVKEKPPPHPRLLVSRRFFYELRGNIKCFPPVIKKFMPIQFFTWVGLFTFWLYFTLGLAQHVYGLPIDGEIINSTNYAIILEKATIQAGIYFSVYQWVSVFYAVLLPSLANKYSLKFLHAISLIIGAISIIVASMTQSTLLIIFCMLGVGILWGSIMTLPYAIVSAELPKSKMGVYLGVFNISVTLPQIAAGIFLGFLHTRIFASQAFHTVVF